MAAPGSRAHEILLLRSPMDPWSRTYDLRLLSPGCRPLIRVWDTSNVHFRWPQQSTSFGSSMAYGLFCVSNTAKNCNQKEFEIRSSSNFNHCYYISIKSSVNRSESHRSLTACHAISEKAYIYSVNIKIIIILILSKKI